ncbi:hypothetical protein B0H16DRAFT_1875837 [Mycena metata]|uniref:Uncharacterized protein n=1 Tax=Mycena metata TaxID=1033252 RepID=A0AAD7P2Y8_9AGAR|nr:hypothetical protein B0H16DRAFT_1875837 [Mycena metata]
MRGLCPAFVFSLLQLLQHAAAGLVNTTVDDLNSGPRGNSIVYFPAGAWVSGAVGGCTGCDPLVLSGIAYMNTFHGSLFNQKNKANQSTLPTATLTFFGTSVSVNCILSGALSNPPGTSDMTFTIDGVQAGSFTHSPIGSQGFQSSTVFTSDPLLPGTHTLVISNGRPGGATSLAILDSVEYSYDDLSSTSVVAAPTSSATSTTGASSPARKTKSKLASIVGGIVAAVVVLSLALAGIILHWRRRRRFRPSETGVTSSSWVEPFFLSNATPAQDLGKVPPPPMSSLSAMKREQSAAVRAFAPGALPQLAGPDEVAHSRNRARDSNSADGSTFGRNILQELRRLRAEMAEILAGRSYEDATPPPEYTPARV